MNWIKRLFFGIGEGQGENGKMKTCAALAALFLIVGCAAAPAPPLRYSGPGDQAAFMNARYQCIKEVPNTSVGSGYVGQYGGGYSNASAPSCGAITSCLAAKGYSVDPNGALSPPPETIVGCLN